MVLAQILGPLPLPAASCKLALSANQSFVNDTYAFLLFNTVASEIWVNGVTHSTVTNPERAIIITPGKYLATASISWAANVTGARRLKLIRWSAAGTVL